ncbi:MAG: AraC family transcriptional regulator [Bifidobacteriaceae bacterium]|nr:AraC family transcriptional regulator [Bifidobacteriaceae bacterium]
MGRRLSVEAGVPFCAQTITTRRIHVPAAYDWMEVVTIRRGSGLVVCGDEQISAATREGDVWLLTPNVPCGIRPDGTLTLTRLFLAVRYMVEQIRWQRWPCLSDEVTARMIAQDIAREQLKRFQNVRIERSGYERLCGLLDALVAVSAAQRIRDKYYESAALALGALGIIMPNAQRTAPTRPTRLEVELARRASLACASALTPLRTEVRQARALIELHYRESVPLEWLANQVNLSKQQFHRVFTAQMRKTPLAYRDSIRIQAMVRLLLETDAPVAEIAKRVGWADLDRAVNVFADAVGMRPDCYRDRLRTVEQTPLPEDHLILADDLLVFRH